MKDSRVGTYAVVGLWFALLFKFFVLTQLVIILPALLVGHVLSRGFAVLFIQALPYAQLDQQSKVKPLAKKLSFADLTVSLLICSLAIAFAGKAGAVLVLVLALAFPLLKRWQHRHIGGFSGDTLGACQQVSEVLIYLALLAVQLHQPDWLPEWFFISFWQGHWGVWP